MTRQIDKYDTAYYQDICEHCEEIGIKPEDYPDSCDEYSIIAASIAIDDDIMRMSHYEPYKAYARAYYRSKMIRIEI